MEDTFFTEYHETPQMTDEQMDGLMEGLKAWDEHQRKRAIKNLFKKDSWGSDLSSYNYFVRCWSWLKTFICLCLKNTKGSYLDDNTFCILSYDETQNMESTSWEAVWVSPKLFSGWQVCVGSDGT